MKIKWRYRFPFTEGQRKRKAQSDQDRLKYYEKLEAENNDIKQQTLDEVVKFLYKRGEILKSAGQQHVREWVALTEAAYLIDSGMWKK